MSAIVSVSERGSSNRGRLFSQVMRIAQARSVELYFMPISAQESRDVVSLTYIV